MFNDNKRLSVQFIIVLGSSPNATVQNEFFQLFFVFWFNLIWCLTKLKKICLWKICSANFPQKNCNIFSLQNFLQRNFQFPVANPAEEFYPVILGKSWLPWKPSQNLTFRFNMRPGRVGWVRQTISLIGL